MYTTMHVCVYMCVNEYEFNPIDKSKSQEIFAWINQIKRFEYDLRVDFAIDMEQYIAKLINIKDMRNLQQGTRITQQNLRTLSNQFSHKWWRN